jgi:hypothetical protein
MAGKLHPVRVPGAEEEALRARVACVLSYGQFNVTAWLWSVSIVAGLPRFGRETVKIVRCCIGMDGQKPRSVWSVWLW